MMRARSTAQASSSNIGAFLGLLVKGVIWCWTTSVTGMVGPICKNSAVNQLIRILQILSVLQCQHVMLLQPGDVQLVDDLEGIVDFMVSVSESSDGLHLLTPRLQGLTDAVCVPDAVLQSER